MASHPREPRKEARLRPSFRQQEAEGGGIGETSYRYQYACVCGERHTVTIVRTEGFVIDGIRYCWRYTCERLASPIDVYLKEK